MRRTITENYVLVVGAIWMPAITASLRINLSGYDLENIGEFTRENVEQWLAMHTGDFQGIQDFYATKDDIELPWSTEDGEIAYYDSISEEVE